MIESLHITDYALIEDLTIEFKPGLNIFTGSTGAGKTIIVGALGLALGERVSDEAIRTKAASAVIEAAFTSDSNSSLGDLILEDSGNLLIRREIKSDGRSRAFLNNRQVTLANLKEIGGRLADITGQHRQRGLTDPGGHIQIIDNYAGHEKDLEELADLFKSYNSLISKLDELIDRRDARAAEKELLEFQINEIKAAALEDGEDDLLELEKLQLVNAEKIQAACLNAENSLFGEDGSAAERISLSVKELDKIAKFSGQADSIKNKLDELSILLDEAGIGIRDLADGFEYNPARLEIIEDRLILIKKLKRKYGGTIKDINQFQENAGIKVLQFEDMDSAISTLTAEIAAYQNELSVKAGAVSANRKKAAVRLEKQVIKHVADLAMKGAQFKVDFTVSENDNGPYLVDNKKYAGDESGFDKVEFLICPNPGEELKPLASTASGGELSRLMLAIISALVDSFPRETLVFDEIDSGISGEVASQVGKKLQQLARSRQVICITHLQQIASRGEAHFKVYKGKSKGRAVTKIKYLEGDQRVAEIARLLAGEKISDLALDGAAELLKEGRS